MKKKYIYTIYPDWESEQTIHDFKISKMPFLAKFDQR